MRYAACLVGIMLLGAGCGESNSDSTEPHHQQVAVNPQNVESEDVHFSSQFRDYPIYCPIEWIAKQKVLGVYNSVIETQGLSFIAAEANGAIDVQGAHMGSSYAFWLWNRTASDRAISRITFLTYGNRPEPISGFVLTPPRGQTLLHLAAGEGIVLPLWPKEDALTEQIIALVEEVGFADTVFSMVGLRQMMASGYDARKCFVHEGMNSVQQEVVEGRGRIVHPRYYSMGSLIDIGHGSEIFIGPGGSQQVFYDLGHGENWYEVRAMTEDEKLEAIITPLDNFPQSVVLKTD